MKLVEFALVIIGLGALVMTVHAQDETTNAPLPEPDAAMQELGWFIGEWDVVSRMLMDADNDEWLEEELRTVHTYELGGHLIFEHFFGPLGGAPFEAWSLRTYDVNTGIWQQRWVDTSPGHFAHWQGSFDAEANTFTGYAARFLDDRGNIEGSVAVREIFDNITDESFSWRFERTNDGGETWFVTWTLEYTRAASE